MAQTQGLIYMRRGQRPRVASPSADAAAEVMRLTLRRTKSTFLHLIYAREILESEIAKLAARNIKSVDLNRMQKDIREMEENRDNIDFCVKKEIDFHSIILKASDNVVFEIMLSSVRQLLTESMAKTLKLTGVKRAIEGHKLILENLKQHDSEGAALAMHKHLEMAEEDIRRIET